VTNVDTVLGPVAAEGLGRALAHDHVFLAEQEAIENFNRFWGKPWWDEEARVADAVSKLRAVRDAGIRTIVDPTAVGLGRDVRRIRRVNAEVDLNIVVCTGLYAFLELPNFLKYRSTEALAAFFVRELEEGIDDTGVRAGFIKCAVEEHGIVGDLPRILAAVASASIQTGAPVMVHTNAAAATGLPALDTLTGAGVEPARIVIAHAGDSNDLGYLREIADTGAALGFDRFNIPHFNPDANRIETLAALVADGYADRIHLGHDAACFYDFMIENPPFADERPDFLHISRKMLPAFLEAGITQEQIDQMLVANPVRFFS
jgi:phosphotriesterase-related protein